MHTEMAAAIGSDGLAAVPFVSPFADCFLILDFGESSEMISEEGKLQDIFNRLLNPMLCFAIIVVMITHRRHLKFRFYALIFLAYPMSAVHYGLRE